MIIRLNTTDTVERSLTVKNVNNVSIAVNSSISGNISEVITIKNPTFEILPNETKTIDFITKTDKPGVYSGQVVVAYNNEQIQLASDITVVAIEQPNKTLEIPYIIPVIIILIIIVVILVFFKFQRGKK
jgi:hypothetical protein